MDRNASLRLSKPEFKSEKKEKPKTFLTKSFALVLKKFSKLRCVLIKAVHVNTGKSTRISAWNLAFPAFT